MSCLPKVQEAVAAARTAGFPIVWVVREHHPTGIDVEWTRQHLFANGGGSTLPGSIGAQLVNGLTCEKADLILVKRRFSAFMHTHLDSMLRRVGIKNLVLCGVQTPNCIRATAVDGMGLDYRVSVLADATASKSDTVQEANLEDMRCMGIEVHSTEEWTASLA
ncbi:MAG: hypothetical protein WDW38_009621 [Sanguina aurantia]